MNRSHSQRLCMLGCIIETFEDFLAKRGIDIPNPEKDEDPNASLIYGSDYGELESMIENTLIDLKLIDKERRA